MTPSPRRCLLVSYGELFINSTQHVLAFARALANNHWEARIACLDNLDLPANFRFYSVAPDGSLTKVDPEPADVVHVWTPRAAIWEFLAVHARCVAGVLVLHLEDDEDEVLRFLSGGRLNPTLELTSHSLQRVKLARWALPIRTRALCAVVDGVTVLTPNLRTFAPSTMAVLPVLPPLSDEPPRSATATPWVTDSALSVLFAGTLNPAVEKDFLHLADAVGRLAKEGLPVALYRCGPASPDEKRILARAAHLSGRLHNLGFLSEADRQTLTAQVTVLVQPGAPNAFNRRRFPAKLVDYFRACRPVVMPAMYNWLGLVDGMHARLLHSGSTQELHRVLRELLVNPEEATRVGRQGAEWARDRFNATKIGAELSEFYVACLRAGPRLPWSEVCSIEADIIRGLLADGSRLAQPLYRKLLDHLCRGEWSDHAVRGRVEHSLRSTENVPRVSVILPSYNHRRFLESRCASIRNQIYPNLEIIILDDGSTDGSATFLSQYKWPFPSQFVPSLSNSGNVFSQWAKGLALATGDYVWIAESDDDCDPSFVSRLVHALQGFPRLGLAFCRAQLVSEAGDVLGDCRDALVPGRFNWRHSFVCDDREWTTEMLYRENFIPNASAAIFRRDVLLASVEKGLPFVLSGDWRIYGSILSSHGFAYVSEQLASYRQHTGSVRARAGRAGRAWTEMLQVRLGMAEDFPIPVALQERCLQSWVERVVARMQVDAAGISPGVVAEWVRSAELVDRWFLARLDAHLRRPARSSRDDLSPGVYVIDFSGESPPDLHPLVTLLEAQDGKGERRVAIVWRGRSDRDGWRPQGGFQPLWKHWISERTRAGSKSKSAFILLPNLELGGAEKYALDVIDVLSQAGWRVQVLITHNGENRWRSHFERAADEVIPLSSLCDPEEIGEALQAFVAARTPRIIFHAHSLVGYHFAPLLRATFPQIWQVDWLHLVSAFWLEGGFPRISVERSLALDRTWVVSEALAGWLVERGVPRAKIDVIHAGVAIHPDPVVQRKSMRAQLELGDDTFAIYFVGRLDDQKQVRLLYPILEGLLARSTDFRLFVIGDGPLKSWLVEDVGPRFVGHLDVLGSMAPAEVVKALPGADALILPSREEGIALVLYEAMQARVVPVATDVGGQSELIDGSCGYIFPCDGELVDHFVDALESLMISSEKRINKGEAARQRILTGFNQDIFASKVSQAIRVLESHPPHCDGETVTPPPILLPSALAAQFVGPRGFNEPGDAWGEAARDGSALIRATSALARGLRASPMRNAFARFESRYGPMLGRKLLHLVERFSSSKRSNRSDD